MRPSQELFRTWLVALGRWHAGRNRNDVMSFMTEKGEAEERPGQ